jgi:hypothetical protein
VFLIPRTVALEVADELVELTELPFVVVELELTLEEDEDDPLVEDPVELETEVLLEPVTEVLVDETELLDPDTRLVSSYISSRLPAPQYSKAFPGHVKLQSA